ncbi:hypothetical protein IL306_003290 [Fusarium sp. DS 682]|nr:hypothetical protein IL306_003290 [Fusarium sp. DS 682]
MILTRSQKRKADEAELQDQASVQPARRPKINFYINGKRIKTALDKDDEATVSAPKATSEPKDPEPEQSGSGESRRKMGRLILTHKASKNQWMYPMVIPYPLHRDRTKEPEKKRIKLKLNPCRESKRVQDEVLRQLLESRTAVNKVAEWAKRNKDLMEELIEDISANRAG